MSTQIVVGIFVSLCLVHCVTDWIPFRERVCLLKLKLQEWSLGILQVHVPNAKAYQPFLDIVGVASRKVTSAESIFLLSDYNAHMGTDDKTWKVLSEDKETPTLTETEGFCYSSVPSTECE